MSTLITDRSEGVNKTCKGNSLGFSGKSKENHIAEEKFMLCHKRRVEDSGETV